MTDSSFLRCAIIAGICSLAAPSLKAQSPVQIHPDDGSAGGPRKIAVLADHFTSAEEATFNLAAANFITYGLLADPYFAQHQSALTIKTLFQPWTSGGAESNYGFVLGAGGNCSIGWDEANTVTLLSDAAKLAFPDDPVDGIVVIGNHDYSFGCTGDTLWSYVAIGAVGSDVLAHEFGHLLVGLMDEFSLPANINTQHPVPVPDFLNCSPTTDPSHWGGPGSGGLPECNLYGLGVFHPTDQCKMGVTGGDFCYVCQHALGVYFGVNPDTSNPIPPNRGPSNPDALNPRNIKPPPPTPKPKPPIGGKISGAGFFMEAAAQDTSQTQSVRLLLQLRSGSPATRVLRTVDVKGPVVNEHRRRGNYIYEISESGKTLAVGVIAGDPFQARSYGGFSPRHDAAPSPTGTVQVTIPGVTKQGLLTRNVEIAIYQITSQIGAGGIDPARFTKLRAEKQVTRVAEVTSDALREAAK